MRVLGLVFLAAGVLLLGFASWEYYDGPGTVPPPPPSFQHFPPTNADLLADYYEGDAARQALARECYSILSELSAYTCTQDQLDTMLTILVMESDLTVGAVGDDRKSIGIGQTHKKLKVQLLTRWLRVAKAEGGVDFGIGGTLRRELAYTVMEFRLHLEEAHGNVWEAVRRYNGSGRRARGYARRLMKKRQEIFGHKWAKGEKAQGFRDCKAGR